MEEHITLTADVVVFRYHLHICEVLLIERAKPPYQFFPALPGGKMHADDDSLEETALREVFEETGIRLKEVLSVGMWSKKGRDPRGRYISACYRALATPTDEIQAGSDALRASWFPVMLPLFKIEMAFDHREMLAQAYAAI